MKRLIFIPLFCLVFVLSSCTKHEELSLEEYEALNAEGLQELLAKTMTKPWRGEDFVPGRLGGTWNSSIIKDPKTFNHLIAEGDGEAMKIIRTMTDYFYEYDVVRREWKAQAVSPEIVVDEKNQTLDLICTLRDDMYWSFYGTDKKVPVTSDDIIFWYNEIEGDPAFNSSGYSSQFIKMEDGSEARITLEKIDERRFVYHFPRIVADPILTTNTDISPGYFYESVKKEKGVQGVLDLFSIASDPKLIPSMGKWFLVEYVPGQRLVFKRNPDYWEKDSAGLSVPYVEEQIIQILPDQNTQYLVFKQGKLDAYLSRPEDLNELVTRKNAGYTVFNSEGTLSAELWSFNQNPKNKDTPQYDWFTKKEFRQAMSCLLNRDRLNAQVYRGLAEPKLDFFPPPNPFYNPDITLEYLYNPQRALELLESVGFTRDDRGILRDDKNRRVEFDLTYPADVSVYGDVCSIIADELGKIGIRLNLRATDFQKMIEQIDVSYDWHSITLILGTYLFPIQGINVWPSNGSLHLWHPSQEKPATDWEARIDYLYNEGSYTIDREKAKAIWDEYQRIILEQCPLIYLMRSRGFWAIQNRWDFSNVYYDNLDGVETSHVFLSK